MVRKDSTADASFAAIFDLIKFGIAIAAMIRMIATTMRSSINEKPLCLVIINTPRSCWLFRAEGSHWTGFHRLKEFNKRSYCRAADPVGPGVQVAVDQRITPLSSEQK